LQFAEAGSCEQTIRHERPWKGNVPQWLYAPPPLQVLGELHVPQLSLPPQPSPAVPQS
jgi:hypothetical protein